MNIILYTNDCPKCRILKQKLDEKHIKYELCNDIEVMKSKGFRSVPMLEINGDILDYLNAVNWTKEI